MQYHRGNTTLALQFSKWLQGIPEGGPRQQVDEMPLCVCVVIELSHNTKWRACAVSVPTDMYTFLASSAGTVIQACFASACEWCLVYTPLFCSTLPRLSNTS